MAKKANEEEDNPKIAILPGREEYIEELGKSVTINKPRVFFVDDISKDYHTEYGIIKASDLKKKGGSVVKSSKGKELTILSAQFIDRYKRIERSAQIIPIKDIGTIITNTGIGKQSRVVDAGAGSGGMSIMLSYIAKEVTTYEIRDDFYNLVKRNIEKLGIKNLNIKKKDVYEGIDEKEVDAITLDLPEPWKAIKPARKSLKVGGFLSIYNPSIIQVSDAIEKIKQDGSFHIQKIIEVIEREWEVKGRKVRPKSKGIGHSGFIAIVRKVR